MPDPKPTDLRPWFCLNCGDRFVRDQADHGVHWTVRRPRTNDGKDI